MSLAGRRSRRLGILKEREESLGANGVYEQLAPEDHYLSCEFQGLRIFETRLLTCAPSRL